MCDTDTAETAAQHPAASTRPAFDFEVWLSTALLAVTFPFLTFHADFFSMWPLAESREEKNEVVEQLA
ncbi:hypothetical protein [Streptomyces sp. YIM S03343]